MRHFKQAYDNNEYIKQAVDQSAHVILGVVATIGLAAILPNIVAPFVVAALWAGREYAQWPSARILDPIADWGYQLSGILLGSLIIFT